MRAKRLIGAVAVGALVCGGAAVAGAYTIDDNLWSLKSHSRSNADKGWMDVVGNPLSSGTLGIDVSWSGTVATFNFYTYADYDSSFSSGGTTYHMYLADLAIDPDMDGDFDYGVVLYNHSNWSNIVPNTNPIVLSNLDVGLYEVSDWYTSYDFYEEVNYPGYPNNPNDPNVGGAAYGEWYDNKNNPGADPRDPFVAIKAYSGSSLPITFYNRIGGPLYTYSFSFDAKNLKGFNGEMNIFWGTQTCGNDAIGGTTAVPEPATMLLLGTGLAGLASLRGRRGRGNLIKKVGCQC